VEKPAKNEPVVDIWFNRFWTLIGPERAEWGWHPAVKAGVGGQLGNLRTSVETIIDFRFGLNLQPETRQFIRPRFLASCL